MKKFLVLIFCLISSLCVVYGQANSADVTKQINAIKLDNTYITAESTAESWETAADNARALLEVNVLEWIKTTDVVDNLEGFIAKSKKAIVELKTMRGNRYRVFLFVKKSDILTFEDKNDMLVVPVQKIESEATTSSSAVVPLQNDSQVKSDVEVTTVEKETTPVIVIPKPYQPTADEQTMLEVTSFDQVNAFLSKYKNNLDSFGKYKDMPREGDCYLFVYNPQGEVPACLFRGNEGFMNVKTGSADDIKNYKGCGAVWFKYKK